MRRTREQEEVRVRKKSLFYGIVTSLTGGSMLHNAVILNIEFPLMTRTFGRFVLGSMLFLGLAVYFMTKSQPQGKYRETLALCFLFALFCAFSGYYWPYFRL